MSFNLHSGLFISNPIVSIAFLFLWAYLVRKNFEVAFSIILVGSHLFQYSEINLFIWTGSLLLPTILIFLPTLFKRLIKINRLQDNYEKMVFYVISIFFIYPFLKGLLLSSDYYNFALSQLQKFSRMYIPFYGVYALTINKESIIKHVKSNAYTSIFICVGLGISVITTLIYVRSLDALRFITFWKMPLSAFSALALWGLFYYIAIFFSGELKKIYKYVPLFLTAIIILLGQSRGLAISLGIGLIFMLIYARKKMVAIASMATTLVILISLSGYLRVDISGQNLTYFDVYYNRFSQVLTPGFLYEESRYQMWQEGWESIEDNPFGGGRISSRVGIHNEYLSIVLMYGIFGAFYIIILLSMVTKGVLYLKRRSININNIDMNVVLLYTIGILTHALVGALLGGTNTYLYWSIAMIVILRRNFEQNYLYRMRM